MAWFKRKKKLPVRDFITCEFYSDLRVNAFGEGDSEPGEEFIIKANGRDIHMIIVRTMYTSVSGLGYTWEARDFYTVDQERRM